MVGINGIMSEGHGPWIHSPDTLKVNPPRRVNNKAFKEDPPPVRMACFLILEFRSEK